MPKTDLDKRYTHKGRGYGPGLEVDIPQSLYDILHAAGVIPEVGYEDREDVREESTEGVPEPTAEPGQVEATRSILDALSPRQADALRAAGYETDDDLLAASDEELRAVSGVGAATVEQIRAIEWSDPE